MVKNSLNNSSFDCKSNALRHPHKPTEIHPADNTTRHALKAIQELDLKVELCGSWLWIFKVDASHAAPLRAANFKWSYQKGAWYFCPNKNTPRLSSKRPPTPMEKVREKYGSQVIQLL